MRFKSFLQNTDKEVVKPFYFIESNTQGRVLVIADIHGHNKTLKALLKKVQLTKQDYLFLLGDYIDRGDDDVSVIQTIMDLVNDDYLVFPLKGNHEEKIIQRHSLVSDLTTPVIENPEEITDEVGRIHHQFVRFFSSLPYYYEMDDFYLVHAGFDFSKIAPFKDYDSMLWIREIANPTPKTIVRGHVITELEAIRTQVIARHSIINLDNGIYLGQTVGNIPRDIGNLCCLDLKSFELITQENIG